MPEKGVILILKNFWGNMREILKETNQSFATFLRPSAKVVARYLDKVKEYQCSQKSIFKLFKRKKPNLKLVIDEDNENPDLAIINQSMFYEFLSHLHPKKLYRNFMNRQLTLSKLFKICETLGEEELRDYLRPYDLKDSNLDELMMRILELSEEKKNDKYWEEYSIQNMTDLRGLASPISYRKNGSTNNDLTFSPPLKDQLKDMKLGKNLILNGYDLMLIEM